MPLGLFLSAALLCKYLGIEEPVELLLEGLGSFF
jgi:hypothetical protein